MCVADTSFGKGVVLTREDDVILTGDKWTLVLEIPIREYEANANKLRNYIVV